ncbi:MAG: SH3 domain-containing protein [Eubacteriales bacterium]
MSRRHLRKFTLGFVSSLMITTSVYGSQQGTIAANVLNVRSGPSTSNTIISKLYKGQEVKILEHNNDWYQIETNNSIAYIYDEYVDITDPDSATVTASKLNVRNKPSLYGNKLAQLNKGEEVSIISKSGEWYYVTDGNITGYVFDSYLNLVDSNKSPQGESNERELLQSEKDTNKIAVVNASVLNVRQQPSLGSSIINKVYRYNQLDVIKVTTDWVEIKTNNGNKGFVYKDYVTFRDKTTPENIDGIRQDVINHGKKFLGNPYLYGGNSLTNGIDCSAFTQQILGEFGYSITRTSRTQFNDGVRVSINELLPGDLIFYGNNNYISHVAMYIGNNEIIHANTPSTGIIISSMNIGKPIIGASRIIY